MLKYSLRYGALLCMFQALVACGSSPVAEKPKDGANNSAPQKQYDTLIVAFGDSLYAGYRLAPNEGLAPQLEARLQKEGMNARVHPAGVSGDTTAAGKARLTFVLDNLERKPDLLILGLGGNDMLRGIQPEQTEENLTAMLEELKKRNINVLLTGMVAAPNLGEDYANKFNKIYPELAKKYDAALMPFILNDVVMDKALMLDDAIHPNPKGVMKIVDGLAPLVEKAMAPK